MATDPPARVKALAAERARARDERNFIAADALRDEIAEAGWQVVDTDTGFELSPLPAQRPVAPSEIGLREGPPTYRAGIHLLYEGFPEDLARFLSSLNAHNDLPSIELVVINPLLQHAEIVSELIAPVASGRVILLDRDPGWAAARNAGFRDADSELILMADLSIEPTGDIVTPLVRAFESDPDLAVAGPIGVVTSDLREWQEAATERCDAIEGYLLATRRELIRRAGPMDERFTWYRNADLAFSLQLRDLDGGDARIVEVPIAKHQHRGYLIYPDADERTSRSRRNYNLLLDRWRNATHLLTGAPARS